MGSPVRFTWGLTTSSKNSPLGDFPFPDPFHTGSNPGLDVVSYANDFFGIGSTTSDWTIVGVSSTFATVDGLGGVVAVTPGAATTATTVYQAKSGFQVISGNDFWYLCRIKPSAVAGAVSYYFGLQNGAAATHGIWFSKAASSTSLNLVSTVNSVATTLVTGVDTAVAGQFHDVGFYYNGTEIVVFANDNIVARVAAPVTVGASGTTLTNVLMAPVFQITPTATDTLQCDYVLSACEMVR